MTQRFRRWTIIRIRAVRAKIGYIISNLAYRAKIMRQVLAAKLTSFLRTVGTKARAAKTFIFISALIICTLAFAWLIQLAADILFLTIMVMIMGWFMMNTYYGLKMSLEETRGTKGMSGRRRFTIVTLPGRMAS